MRERLLAVSDIPPTGSVSADLLGREVLVTMVNGKPRAYVNVCQHHGGPLVLDGDRFTCEIVRLIRGKMTVKTDALGTVAVTDTSVFVASTDGKLSAFPAKGCGATTCTPTWTAPSAGGPPSVAGSVLFVGSADGHLRAFDARGCGAATCTPKWDTDVGAALWNAPAVSDGRVFVTDSAGVLHAYGLP